MTSGVEFVSEAQEIIESLSKDLLSLERGVRANEEYDPDLLNSAFRAVHTHRRSHACWSASFVGSKRTRTILINNLVSQPLNLRHMSLDHLQAAAPNKALGTILLLKRSNFAAWLTCLFQ